MTVTEKIAKNIIKYRKLKNLTQSDVAQILGITRAGYAHYEQGTRSISFEHALQLGELFGVSTNTLGYDEEYEIQSVSMVDDSFLLSDHEKEVITAYRSAEKALQDGIDRMLGIEPLVTEQQAKKIG